MKPRHKKPKPKDVGMVRTPFFDLFKKPSEKQHQHNAQKPEAFHDHGTPPPEGIPIYTIAVLLDGQVYEVLRAQEKLADIFLSAPKFVLVDEDTGQARIGMDYKDGKFTEKQ
jgi:hypothetical protein